MILSMTGYGKSEYTYADHKTIVELRSLNSKQLDLNLKVNNLFRDKEADIRSMLTTPLERGKVDVSIYTQQLDNTTAPSTSFTPINKEAFAYYYHELTDLQDSLGFSAKDIVSAILRLPDVVKTSTNEVVMNEEEWALLQQAVMQAVEAFRAFRIQEGAALECMFNEKLNGIQALLEEVEPYEKGRVEKIKQHLLQNLDKLAEETKQKIDQNRLEAEMIYYLEKLDITEEKVRLANHLRYFRETMNGDGTGVGKKLGFIAQEMGREINTLGSKSNQSEMQIIVVKMKDILEQIKEQVLNVL
ncbi:MAG: YicC family protein [Paludibacteraceae bacterium]|nr:YicC family protein [Paludibacteraceae bacterium]